MEVLKIDDYEVFRKLLLDNTGVSCCTRAHFGNPLPQEKDKYIRFAYSNVTIPEIKEAMGILKEYMEKAFAEAGTASS